MDSIKNSGLTGKQISNLSNLAKNPWKNPNLGFKQMQMKKTTKKMKPEMIAKRKKKMISNAASKVMGGQYSK